MRTNGIEEIRIQNYKALRAETLFDIKRKHVLVFGPNGSGKSSLYWALHTLFHSSEKNVDGIKKYFDKTYDENLLNIHEPTLPSFIKIKTTVAGEGKDYEVTIAGVTGERNKLQELNRASEFVSHRLLINFYNFPNSSEINLIEVFNRDILTFVYGEVKFRNEVLRDVITKLERRVTEMQGKYWRRIQIIKENELVDLNREIERLIEFINNNATKFLEDNFTPNDLKIKIVIKGAYWIEEKRISNKVKYFFHSPSYKLSVEHKKDDGTWENIERPQSFLNEARLTRIGIAVRFCLLNKRLQNVPLRILALDDMLISLDLDNRVKLIETIMNLYKESYQIFIFTHEKGFFNEVKRNIIDEIDDWKIYEFKPMQNNRIKFDNAKTEMQRAKSFLQDGELENCALELRKLGEIIFRNFIQRKKSELFNTKDFVTFSNMLDEAANIVCKEMLGKFEKSILSQEVSEDDLRLVFSDKFDEYKKDNTIDGRQKARIIAIKKSIVDLIGSVKTESTNALAFVLDVRKIKDRLLNYGAHPSDDALYTKEMEDAIDLFENLQGVLSRV